MPGMNSSADPPPSTTRIFCGRVRQWKLRSGTLEVDKLPLLMGVINVTPDSFSDGGRFLDPAAAVDRGLRLAAEGADVLDVGGQSTRPYSRPVEADEELRRVVPVVTALHGQTPVPISIDTSKAIVAREAVAAGAQILNDITALTGDREMLEVASATGVGVCAMHVQGTPRTMQENPVYEDVLGEILAYLGRRRDQLVAAGIEQARIALDPGIGFGKTTAHNLALLRGAWRLHELGCPLLVGPSRKGFIAKVLGAESADRTPGTIGVALSLARQGVQILRVHDVGAVKGALMLYEAAGGLC